MDHGRPSMRVCCPLLSDDRSPNASLQERPPLAGEGRRGPVDSSGRRWMHASPGVLQTAARVGDPFTECGSGAQIWSIHNGSITPWGSVPGPGLNGATFPISCSVDGAATTTTE